MLFLVSSLLITYISVLESRNIDHAVPGQYIVRLNTKHVSSKSEVSSFTAQLKNVYASNVIETLHIGTMTVMLIFASEETVADLSKSEDVLYVEPNVHVQATHTINNKHFSCSEYDVSSTWHLQRLSQRKIDVHETFSSSDADNGFGVDVYVLDSGIATEHPDFDGRAKHSFKAPSITHEDHKDYSGHGTHVAGVIGSTTYGVAKNVTMWSVKVLDSSNDGNLISVLEGIEHVTTEYQLRKDTTGRTPKFICNLSLGFLGEYQTMEDAITESIDMGINFVIAAGNEGMDACGISPARVRRAVTVAASDRSDSLAGFSNYGRCVDIIAPGVDILSTHIIGTRTLDGTSQAAPAVTGAMARILSGFDACSDLVLTPDDIKGAVLLASTRDSISLTGATSSTPNKFAYINCKQALQSAGCVFSDFPEAPSNSPCPPYDDSTSDPTQGTTCDAVSCMCCADTYGQPCLQPLHIGLIAVACVCVAAVLISINVFFVLKSQKCRVASS